jgi:predicted nucleic acid-binding protein
MLTEDAETALDMLEKAGTAGNLTTDAQIAAVAVRLDAEVHTADLDFGRFANVRFFESAAFLNIPITTRTRSAGR